VSDLAKKIPELPELPKITEVLDVIVSAKNMASNAEKLFKEVPNVFEQGAKVVKGIEATGRKIIK